jgi:DNA-binding NtrC family response regulator
VETLRANVRIVAATNRHLLELATVGRYRADLYYRIASIDLRLPSLRERRADIPALAEVILKRITVPGGQRCELSDAAIRKLMSYDFPGNVRELRNTLIKAVALCRHHLIDEEYIVFAQGAMPPALSASPASVSVSSASGAQLAVTGAASVQSMAEMEAGYIARLLHTHGGHRRRVADILGISERTLYRKLKHYNLAEG